MTYTKKRKCDISPVRSTMQEHSSEPTPLTFQPRFTGEEQISGGAPEVEATDDLSPVPDSRKNRKKKLLIYATLLVLLTLTVSLSAVNLVFNYRHSGKIKSMLTVSGLTGNPAETTVTALVENTKDSLGLIAGRANQQAFPPRYIEENISHPPGRDEKINAGTEPVKLKPGLESNLPSIVTFRQDEKNIRLILLQNEVLELQVDSLKIEPAAFRDFQSFIETGKALIRHNATPQQNESSMTELQREEQRQNEVFRNTMLKALARDGLIREGQAPQVYLLWNNLYVDGQSQSRELFEKYKALYEEITGQHLKRQSEIQITH